MNAIKNLVNAVIAKMMKKDASEWPPTCSWLTYQPVRPDKADMTGHQDAEQ